MKKKNIISIALASAFALSAFSLVACGEPQSSTPKWNGADEWLTQGIVVPTATYQLPAKPSLSTAAVHDPSVFLDPIDNNFYTFGSHFAVGVSTNLMDWKQKNGDGNAKTLYGTANFRSILEQSSAHVGTSGGINSTWAPDVEYINGMYYMYYSLTSAFGSSKSVIGRVSSYDLMGPYMDEEIIVKSNGEAGAPNAIDPELFYDKNGGLWMVYGSFYGGIFIKELTEDGLPKEDGYGKLLWKRGDRAGVEGPFIFYNAETDYYYLMVSEGDLNTTYNMRVARSKNPDGPYLDITGKDVATNDGRGNKIAGNYQFAGDKQGFAAMGHNSVVKRYGQYFVVYHTRFRVGSTGDEISGYHNLYTNQLFFNEDGWPVMNPNRYAEENKGLVTQEQGAGEYDIVLHEISTTSRFAESVRYTLNADGTVTKDGASAGSWTVKEDYYVEITLDGVTYKGVFTPAWSTYREKGILSITAVSDTGRSLWANGI